MSPAQPRSGLICIAPIRLNQGLVDQEARIRLNSFG